MSETNILKQKIFEILKGIDETETCSDDGWWETSTGEEFGKEILVKLSTLLDEYDCYLKSEGI